MALLAAALAVSEGLLRLAASASPKAARLLTGRPAGPEREFRDGRLGAHPNPAFPGHDSNGFRNPVVPRTAEIVVFGDSQTYGLGVPLHETWPRLLEAAGAGSVYTLAYGGFAPPHYLLLWDEARKLAPRAVLAAFYAGNDLYDSYAIASRLAQFGRLLPADASRREELARLEASSPLARKAMSLVGQPMPEDPAKGGGPTVVLDV